MTGYVLTSDVHLTPQNPELFQEWVTCVDHALHHIESNQRHILILGDLWDLYIHGNLAFKETIQLWCEQRQKWEESGVKVDWYEGNHDLYLPRIDRTFVSGALTFHACHGDELNPEDKSYLRFKKALHTPPIPWLLRHLPGSFVKKVGTKLSHASRESWAPSKPWNWNTYETQILEHFKTEKENSPQLFIFGHCHFKTDIERQGLRIVNLGYFPHDKSVFIVDNTRARWVNSKGVIS